ncbi:MAG TPA: hypothetical protein VGQ33_20645, partial [Vicinamibacteria bacterium]|nr:hypothetical protein [Vicinamibacteria bacterium]
MTHAWRDNARGGQLIVEPRGRLVAEIGADRGLHRRQHLQQNENDADYRQWRRKSAVLLDGADEGAHGNRKNGGQRT